MPPLCIQLCQSEYEEPFVDHSSKLCPKGFDFSVEGFRCRIGSTVHKVVQYPLVMIFYGVCHSGKRIVSICLDFVVPQGKFGPCHIFVCIVFEDFAQP